MENKDELNLLSINFNSLSAINNLESVFLPKQTQSLDNIYKAALLLPFAIQKELKLFDKCDTSSEKINDENMQKNQTSTERQLNTFKNIEYKLNLKKRFSNKKKKFMSISSSLTEKFSIQPSKYFQIEEEKKNLYNYFTRKKVSILN